MTTIYFSVFGTAVLYNISGTKTQRNFTLPLNFRKKNANLCAPYQKLSLDFPKLPTREIYCSINVELWENIISKFTYSLIR